MEFKQESKSFFPNQQLQPSLRSGIKHGAHPIVCGLMRVRGKRAGVAVRENAVGTPWSICRRVQWSIVSGEGRKKAPIRAVVASGAEVRCHVQCVRSDGHGIREIDLLPAGSRFVGESSRGQQRSGAAPEIADVCSRVGSAFIEANTHDVAVHVGTERNTKLDWRVGPNIGICGNSRARPQRAWAIPGGIDGDALGRVGRLRGLARIRYLDCKVKCSRLCRCAGDQSTRR